MAGRDNVSLRPCRTIPEVTGEDTAGIRAHDHNSPLVPNPFGSVHYESVG